MMFRLRYLKNRMLGRILIRRGGVRDGFSIPEWRPWYQTLRKFMGRPIPPSSSPITQADRDALAALRRAGLRV
jgi:hypothetical protein